MGEYTYVLWHHYKEINKILKYLFNITTSLVKKKYITKFNIQLYLTPTAFSFFINNIFKWW